MEGIHGPKLRPDLGSLNIWRLNIRQQMHRRLFIFLTKGISHQSRINNETLFIETDIKTCISFKYWVFCYITQPGATCDFDRQTHPRGAN